MARTVNRPKVVRNPHKACKQMLNSRRQARTPRAHLAGRRGNSVRGTGNPQGRAQHLPIWRAGGEIARGFGNLRVRAHPEPIWRADGEIACAGLEILRGAHNICPFGGQMGICCARDWKSSGARTAFAHLAGRRGNSVREFGNLRVRAHPEPIWRADGEIACAGLEILRGAHNICPFGGQTGK
jgi:hypothetical protein